MWRPSKRRSTGLMLGPKSDVAAAEEAVFTERAAVALAESILDVRGIRRPSLLSRRPGSRSARRL